jgi:hypothetical protein
MGILDNDMKKVVKCGCGGNEYFGMMYWRDGHMYCRHCIEKIWREYDGWNKDGKYKNAFKYYYPHYEDGIDYSREE